MNRRTILALMTLLSLAIGASAQTKLIKPFSFTVDSTLDSLYLDTTFVVALPSDEELGLIWGMVRWDSLGGVFADSAKMTVREAYDEDVNKPFIASDGSAMDWQAVKIYDGGTSWVNWTVAVPISDNDRFKISWEMGESPWYHALIDFEMWDSLAAEGGNPHGKWYFDFYCKKK